MRRKSFKQMECGIAQTLEQLGDVWSFLIIREALFGVEAFDDFHQNLAIPKNTLSARLNDLVDIGLLSRTRDEADKRRVIYRLEEAGRDFWVVLVALSQWGNKWVYKDQGPPSFVADKALQKPVSAIEIKNINGQRLTLNDIAMILGPSGSKKLGEKLAHVNNR